MIEDRIETLKTRLPELEEVFDRLQAEGSSSAASLGMIIDRLEDDLPMGLGLVINAESYLND